MQHDVQLATTVARALAAAGVLFLLHVCQGALMSDAIETPSYLAGQRHTLMDIYYATEGKSWRSTGGGSLEALAWGSDLHFCTWEGVICCMRQANGSNLFHLPPSEAPGFQLSRLCSLEGEVQALALNGFGLQGTLPDSIMRLFGLQVLRLAGNPGLTGSLPPSLLLSDSLQEVDVRGSGMSCSASQVPCNFPTGFLRSDLLMLYESEEAISAAAQTAVQATGTSLACSAFLYRHWTGDQGSSRDSRDGNDSDRGSRAGSGLSQTGGGMASRNAAPRAVATVLLASPGYWHFQTCRCLQGQQAMAATAMAAGTAPAVSWTAPVLRWAEDGSLQVLCGGMDPASAPALAAHGIGFRRHMKEGSGVPLPVFIGVVSTVGGVAALALIAIILWCRLRMRRAKARRSDGGSGSIRTAPEAKLRWSTYTLCVPPQGTRYADAMTWTSFDDLPPTGAEADAAAVAAAAAAGSQVAALTGGVVAAKRAKPPGSYPALFGTDVTLVATDVEGSTELWEWQPGIMNSALALHDRLIRLTISVCCGYEITTEGDAFLVAFHEPVDAVRWALLLQSALLKLDWPPLLLEHPLCRPRPLVPVADPRGGRGGGGGDSNAASLLVLFKGLAVRMGIATGVPSAIREHPVTRRMQYTGAVLRLATGIAELGSGGQVLLEPMTFKGIHNKFEELDVVEGKVQELADVVNNKSQALPSTNPVPSREAAATEDVAAHRCIDSGLTSYARRRSVEVLGPRGALGETHSTRGRVGTRHASLNTRQPALVRQNFPWLSGGLSLTDAYGRQQQQQSPLPPFSGHPFPPPMSTRRTSLVPPNPTAAVATAAGVPLTLRGSQVSPAPLGGGAAAVAAASSLGLHGGGHAVAGRPIPGAGDVGVRTGRASRSYRAATRRQHVHMAETPGNVSTIGSSLLRTSYGSPAGPSGPFPVAAQAHLGIVPSPAASMQSAVPQGMSGWGPLSMGRGSNDWYAIHQALVSHASNTGTVLQSLYGSNTSRHSRPGMNPLDLAIMLGSRASADSSVMPPQGGQQGGSIFMGAPASLFRSNLQSLFMRTITCDGNGSVSRNSAERRFLTNSGTTGEREAIPRTYTAATAAAHAVIGAGNDRAAERPSTAAGAAAAVLKVAAAPPQVLHVAGGAGTGNRSSGFGMDGGASIGSGSTAASRLVVPLPYGSGVMPSGVDAGSDILYPAVTLQGGLLGLRSSAGAHSGIIPKPYVSSSGVVLGVGSHSLVGRAGTSHRLSTNTGAPGLGQDPDPGPELTAPAVEATAAGEVRQRAGAGSFPQAGVPAIVLSGERSGAAGSPGVSAATAGMLLSPPPQPPPPPAAPPPPPPPPSCPGPQEAPQDGDDDDEAFLDLLLSADGLSGRPGHLSSLAMGSTVGTIGAATAIVGRAPSIPARTPSFSAAPRACATPSLPVTAAAQWPDPGKLPCDGHAPRWATSPSGGGRGSPTASLNHDPSPEPELCSSASATAAPSLLAARRLQLLLSCETGTCDPSFGPATATAALEAVTAAIPSADSSPPPMAESQPLPPSSKLAPSCELAGPANSGVAAAAADAITATAPHRQGGGGTAANSGAVGSGGGSIPLESFSFAPVHKPGSHASRRQGRTVEVKRCMQHGHELLGVDTGDEPRVAAEGGGGVGTGRAAANSGPAVEVTDVTRQPPRPPRLVRKSDSFMARPTASNPAQDNNESALLSTTCGPRPGQGQCTEDATPSHLHPTPVPCAGLCGNRPTSILWISNDKQRTVPHRAGSRDGGGSGPTAAAADVTSVSYVIDPRNHSDSTGSGGGGTDSKGPAAAGVTVTAATVIAPAYSDVANGDISAFPAGASAGAHHLHTALPPSVQFSREGGGQSLLRPALNAGLSYPHRLASSSYTWDGSGSPAAGAPAHGGGGAGGGGAVSSGVNGRHDFASPRALVPSAHGLGSGQSGHVTSQQGPASGWVNESLSLALPSACALAPRSSGQLQHSHFQLPQQSHSQVLLTQSLHMLLDSLAGGGAAETRRPAFRNGALDSEAGAGPPPFAAIGTTHQQQQQQSLQGAFQQGHGHHPLGPQGATGLESDSHGLGAAAEERTMAWPSGGAGSWAFSTGPVFGGGLGLGPGLVPRSCAAGRPQRATGAGSSPKPLGSHDVPARLPTFEALDLPGGSELLPGHAGLKPRGSANGRLSHYGTAAEPGYTGVRAFTHGQLPGSLVLGPAAGPGPGPGMGAGLGMVPSVPPQPGLLVGFFRQPTGTGTGEGVVLELRSAMLQEATSSCANLTAKKARDLASDDAVDTVAANVLGTVPLPEEDEEEGAKIMEPALTSPRQQQQQGAHAYRKPGPGRVSILLSAQALDDSSDRRTALHKGPRRTVSFKQSQNSGENRGGTLMRIVRRLPSYGTGQTDEHTASMSSRKGIVQVASFLQSKSEGAPVDLSDASSMGARRSASIDAVEVEELCNRASAPHRTVAASSGGRWWRSSLKHPEHHHQPPEKLLRGGSGGKTPAEGSLLSGALPSTTTETAAATPNPKASEAPGTRNASHSLVVVDMGVHRLQIPALGAEYGDVYDGVQVIQILPAHLKHRAAYLPPLKSQAQLAPGFLDAPGASQALLPCAPCQQPSFPRLSLMFIQPTGYSAVANANIEVAERSKAVFCGAVREVLALFGAYECQEYEGTFMVACAGPRIAAEAGLALQEWLLQADWPSDLLELSMGRLVLKLDGTPLTKGFRAKVGIFTGVPLLVVPHATTGRADYFGALVNRAARLMAGAKPGQILMDKPSGLEVVREWRQMVGDTVANANTGSTEVMVSADDSQGLRVGSGETVHRVCRSSGPPSSQQGAGSLQHGVRASLSSSYHSLATSLISKVAATGDGGGGGNPPPGAAANAATNIGAEQPGTVLVSSSQGVAAITPVSSRESLGVGPRPSAQSGSTTAVAALVADVQVAPGRPFLTRPTSYEMLVEAHALGASDMADSGGSQGTPPSRRAVAAPGAAETTAAVATTIPAAASMPHVVDNNNLAAMAAAALGAPARAAVIQVVDLGTFKLKGLSEGQAVVSVQLKGGAPGGLGIAVGPRGVPCGAQGGAVSGPRRSSAGTTAVGAGGWTPSCEMLYGDDGPTLGTKAVLIQPGKGMVDEVPVGLPVPVVSRGPALAC